MVWMIFDCLCKNKLKFTMLSSSSAVFVIFCNANDCTKGREHVLPAFWRMFSDKSDESDFGKP